MELKLGICLNTQRLACPILDKIYFFKECAIPGLFFFIFVFSIRVTVQKFVVD